MEFTYWSKRKTEIASSGGSSITYIDYFAFFLIEPDTPKMGSMQLMSSFSPQVQANDPLLSGNSPRGKVCLYGF